ncbi:MAG: Na+/H+ antiporter subunit E [Myxococcota bacterium]|nr:Na+/H+ antiporter subunit E [Myxococcota bacterium]
MRRLIPSPVLSVALFGLWVLLNQSVDTGTLLIGALLALVLPRLTLGLRPTPVRIRRPKVIFRLLLRVVWDMLRSNLSVTRTLLTRRSRDIPSAFVRVPLLVRDPNALAVLAMIVTTVPGTAWAELSADRSVLLVHFFSVESEQTLIDSVQNHYQQPLREIFE